MPTLTPQEGRPERTTPQRAVFGACRSLLLLPYPPGDRPCRDPRRERRGPADRQTGGPGPWERGPSARSPKSPKGGRGEEPRAQDSEGSEARGGKGAEGSRDRRAGVLGAPPHLPSVNSHCSFPRERSGTTSRSSIGSARRAGPASLRQRRRDRSCGDKAAAEPSPRRPSGVLLPKSSPVARSTGPPPHHTSAHFASPHTSSSRGTRGSGRSGSICGKSGVRGRKVWRGRDFSRRGGAEGGVAHAQTAGRAPVTVWAAAGGGLAVLSGRAGKRSPVRRESPHLHTAPHTSHTSKQGCVHHATQHVTWLYNPHLPSTRTSRTFQGSKRRVPKARCVRPSRD